MVITASVREAKGGGPGNLLLAAGDVISVEEQLFIYPAKHFVTPEERISRAVVEIRTELDERLG